MTDETDANDHEREKILSRNVYKIIDECEKLSNYEEKLRDVGLGSIADVIQDCNTRIWKNVDEIKNRFEYTIWKERKHFTTNDDNNMVSKRYLVLMNVPVSYKIEVSDIKQIINIGISEIRNDIELDRIIDQSSQ